MPALFFKNLLSKRNKDFAGVVLSPPAQGISYRSQMRIRQLKVLEQTRSEHPVAALFETFAICSGKGQESLFFLYRSGAMPLESFFSP